MKNNKKTTSNEKAAKGNYDSTDRDLSGARARIEKNNKNLQENEVPDRESLIDKKRK